MLRAIPGVGDALLLRLVQALGTPESVLTASSMTLEQVGCRPPLIEAIHRGPDGTAVRQFEEELDQLDRRQVSVLTYLDATYPASLRTIADPPPLLYLRGTLLENDRQALAIVGTRKVSASGRVFAEELAHDLAARGFTIVSDPLSMAASVTITPNASPLIMRFRRGKW